MEQDLEVIRSSKGTSYPICIEADGITEYFEVIKEPIFDNAGGITGIVGLINNMTEHELLKQRLQWASQMDGLTGLFNRKEIEHQIQVALEDVKKKKGRFL